MTLYKRLKHMHKHDPEEPTSELNIRRGIEDNSKIIFLISHLKHVVTPY